MQTVDRALNVLLSFNDDRQSWSVSELAEAFGLSTSTAQRLLASLTASRFVTQDRETRRYALGPAAWRVSEFYERSGGLARFAESILQPLAAGTQLTAQFTVPDGSHVRCVAAADGTGPTGQRHPWVGDIYPAFAGATPRAYFAFLPPSERYSHLQTLPLVRYTAETPIDVSEILKLYEETHERGWAHSCNEYNAGSEAIGVPIMFGSRPRGSISLVRLGVQGEDRAPLEQHVPRLLHAAATFAAQLSSNSPSPTR